MNYKELKEKNKERLALQAKIETLRSVAESTTKNFSKAPSRSSAKQKSENIDELIILSEEYDELNKFIEQQKKILLTTYEGNCIYQHLFCGRSWRLIAQRIGNKRSKDAIRKMCHNFSW